MTEHGKKATVTIYKAMWFMKTYKLCVALLSFFFLVAKGWYWSLLCGPNP